MEESHCYSTVEQIFKDFRGRRYGILKALTTDYEEFHKQCDPDKDNLCLMGFPDGRWEVNLPCDDVPPEIPDPTIGINFSRDMEMNDWLYLIAIHSDVWLLSVAFFFASNLDIGKDEREQLFDRINALPTLLEVMREAAAKRQQKGKSSAQNDSRNKSESSSELVCRDLNSPQENDEENAVCAACGGHDIPEGANVEHDAPEADIFWIYCETCKRWFHGQCVLITAAEAEKIKVYKCPLCRTRRAHP